jgi:hypothetical protein
MAIVASQPPIRTPSGGTTDQVFQPLADCGNGNPAFYHQFFDEFDQAFSFTTGNTYTITGTGSFAATSGDGGLGLFTTTGVSSAVETIQVVTPSFTVNSQPKKVFFETRITTASAPATTNILAGLISANTTPFTAIVDGVYFSWVGGTGLTINSMHTSVLTSVTIPAAAYTFTAAGQQLDLAFYITRLGDVLAYVDNQLVGFVPQSNIGTTNGPQNAGAVARITAPSLPTAVLSPTLGVQTSSAAIKTVTFDFLNAQKER